MKTKKNILAFLFLAFFLFSGCEEDSFFKNSSDKVKTQVNIETESILSNPMDAGEAWSNTKEYDLKKELEERYGIDLEKNELLSFKITGIGGKWESSRCRKLAEIKTEFLVPEIDDISFSSGGQAWDDQCSSEIAVLFSVDLIGVTLENDPYGITEADFAEAIKRGEKITVKYSLTADEEIEEEGMGLMFSILSVAEFKPK